MRDKQQRQPPHILQPHQQSHHPRLHPGIESRRDFIGYQQFRLKDQRPRDRHTLRFTTAQLVRITLHKSRRCWQVHFRQHFAHFFQPLRL